MLLTSSTWLQAVEVVDETLVAGIGSRVLSLQTKTKYVTNVCRILIRFFELRRQRQVGDLYCGATTYWTYPNGRGGLPQAKVNGKKSSGGLCAESEGPIACTDKSKIRHLL